MRVTLEPAFLLHHRPYRETSVLLDFFTESHGRIAAIAKGVRKERSRWRALLQPFIPVLISFQGRSELMNLNLVEPNGAPVRLTKEALLSGFYLNELLTRLLQKWDPHPFLFSAYYRTLVSLQMGLREASLRSFEKKLLEELGYGLSLAVEYETNLPIELEKGYLFEVQKGLIAYKNSENIQDLINFFSGKSLVALREESWEDEQSLKDAKRLMRLALSPLLGEKPLFSRKMFFDGDGSSSKEEQLKEEVIL